MNKTYFILVLAFIVVGFLFSQAGIFRDEAKSLQTTIEPEDNVEELVTIITSNPLWYQHPTVKPKLDQYFREDEEGKSEAFIKEKRAFIQRVGNLLAEGKVKLGEPLENFDENRKPIETIVIHHTETAPDADFNYINGIHLFTLYIIPVFDNPENEHYGKPIFSGHYDESGKQVFYGYHYIVAPDGTVKHTLKDEYIGYHARQANATSIGISFIGNFEEVRPSDAAIKAAREIINDGYPPKKVVGHKEIVPSTDCPGKLFFGPTGWKQELI